MAAATEPSAAVQHSAEVRRCYQSARSLLKAADAEDIAVPRADFSCLASVVISELGEDATTLRGCLKSSSGDNVSVPRSAMMALMKGVAGWLATHLKAGPVETVHAASANETQNTMDEAAVVNWQGRILVVGAGATGACTALRLRSKLGSGAHITVWEKARGAGGRMSTNRQDSLGARADMGAAYLSLNGADSDCAAVADMLTKANVCGDIPSALLSSTTERPSGSEWRHLAGIQGGVNDALKAILLEAKAQVCYERRLSSLDQRGAQWCAKPFSGYAEEFDAVIVAVPGCGVGGDNLLKIHGGWERMINRDNNQQLRDVQHDQRWAVALFFPRECVSKVDSFFGSQAVEKTVGDNVVHLLCYQSRKVSYINGPATRDCVVVVAHTTTDWARKNSRANGRDQRLLNEVSDRVSKIIGLGRVRLLASKVITWKQCQVTKAIPSSHLDEPCMLLNSAPPLLLAGDYFTQSNFGGCLKSAYAAADVLVKICSTGGGKKRSGDILNSSSSKRNKSSW